ncbi:hypothetical protein BMF94_4103 [Rhodotorula taiwanensis]|uniref:Uncharacterized protein n=1 Tax=Rhodotorula taiwanensis TaxID=741276 RepID=A0A2S5B7U8_9BASI|nr:hypothetical protein BMF94_4103 [Rhodotorula taiwanensis]
MASPPGQGQHRLASPPLSSAHGTGGPTERDPFLAQTAGIPLTEQDRQEGYDVELLNARPRGRYSADLDSIGAGAGAGGAAVPAAGLDTDDDSLNGREKYAGTGTGLAQVSSHPGLAPPTAALGAAGAGGIALGPIGGAHHAYGGIDGPLGGAGLYNKEFAGANGLGNGSGGGSGGTGRFSSGGANSGTTAVSGRRKPWFLRPLPLLLVAGVVIGIALAVGLGVGLSQSGSKSSKDLAASGSDRNGTSSSRSSRSRSIGSTGTVVPSSLYSSYTSDHPQSSTTLVVVQTAVTTNGTAVSTATFVTSVPAPANGTTLATTGNRPVPAASSTLINGTIFVSALTQTTEFAAATATFRARGRR